MKKMICFRVLALIVGTLVSLYLIVNKITSSKRSLEIVPGVKWEYYSDHYSRLVWDKFGVVVAGKFDLVVCDYGIYVLSNDMKVSCYLDLCAGNVVKSCSAGTNLWGRAGGVFSIDAPTAMGIYESKGKSMFEDELRCLRNRIRGRSLGKTW